MTRRFCCVLVVILVLSFVSLFVQLNGAIYRNETVFLLFILDFNDFLCHSCLSTLVNFVQQLPPQIQVNNIRWILVQDQKSGRSREEAYGIMAKQLRGFVKTYHIKFPCSIDSDSLFRDLTEEGSVVLLFSGETQPIRSYSFPLDNEAVDEILSLLLD